MNPKVKNLVTKYNLDLSDLVILTEAASGAYLLNPFIALAAGAQKVICRVKTSHYASAERVIKETLSIAEKEDCLERIIIKEELDLSDLSEVDIITNSGHLRPIHKGMISALKETAVIPLMWETWEFRDQDLNLDACKQKEILVLGTNESVPPCDMRKYSGMIGVKLALEAGLEIAGNKILLIGSTSTLCQPIKEGLEFLGAQTVWFSQNNPQSHFDYEHLKAYIFENIKDFDGVLIAEHYYPELIFGHDGIVSFSTISQLNPDIKIGISCGNLDVDDLKKSGLHYFPKDIQPFGYMTYQSYHVGSLPVMDLFAAGLKVGEVMARARLKGMSLRESALYALNNSPAMDFEGDLSWL